MNGVVREFHDYTQLENGTLVYGFDEQFSAKTRGTLRRNHLAMFELKKTIEFTGVLKNLYVQYDFDMSIAAFRAKCFEKMERNHNSYSKYVPMITVNGDAYEQYFEECRFGDKTNRISYRRHSQKQLGKFWVSSIDLDRISPVKFKRGVRSLERDMNLLSVHELEELLLSKDRFRVHSSEDVRPFPVLEPLLLKDDSDKVRLRYSEHKKIVRITISYTLAFFLLAIITFYIIYYA